MKNSTILIIDDEQYILNSMRRLLTLENYNVITTDKAREGMEFFKKESIDLVITDLRMPDIDGLEFLIWVKDNYPDTVRFVITGSNDLQYIMHAINKGEIYKFILKPWNNENLIIDVRQALNHAFRLKKNKELQKLIQKQNKELKQLNKNLEKKVLERTLALKEKMVYLENLFENAQEIICTIDPDEKITFVNKQIEKLGYRKEDLIGSSFSDLIKYKKEKRLAIPPVT